jgi:hypothetical protein
MPGMGGFYRIVICVPKERLSAALMLLIMIVLPIF